MRSLFFLSILVLAQSAFPQANLFDHVYWQVYGNREAQGYGGEGLDTIGYVNDTIQHALSIGEAQPGKVVSCFVYNKFKLGKPDTVRHFEFPGQKVIRGDFNHDGRFDVACWDGTLRTITIMFGTTKQDSFTTALKLVGDENKNEFSYLDDRICVADFDSDGFDDFVIYDAGYIEDGINTIGRLLYYRGGAQLDTNPAQVIIGKTGELYYGTLLRVGHIQDTYHSALIEVRFLGPQVKLGQSNEAALYIYPQGRNFSLIPSETLYCELDTPKYCCYNYASFTVLDADKDGVDEVVLTGYDNDYVAGNKVDPVVFAFQFGAQHSATPKYYFHRPFQTGSVAFGAKILDVGDVVGRGKYHSLLVTDPQAFQNDVGAVFLFNMGAAYKDSCVAVAVGQRGSFDRFGIQAVGPGDLSGDKRTEIIVGAQMNPRPTGDLDGLVAVFSGDSSYGPMISGVHEHAPLPNVLRLDQNYPNPFTTTTDVTFAVTNSLFTGKHASVTLYDMLGRKLADLFTGVADGYGYVIRVDGSHLSQGTYVYQLKCGDQQLSKVFTFVK